MTTPAELLRTAARPDPSRPFLTFYDDATGERVELSVATAANWAAKIANLLVEEHGLDAGDDVGVLLPTHWETAVVLLGCWRAGVTAALGTAGALTFHLPADPAAGGDSVELSLSPMGADLARLVGAQPDEFGGAAVDEAAPALRLAARTWSHHDLAADAMHAAAGHGLTSESRVLSTLPYDSTDGLDAGLLAPLAAGGSVVLVGHADEQQLTARCGTERVTHTAGFAVPGLPRLDG